ncbi:MAG: hypothetical protein AB7N76_01290 [Planctomycetota bacterium]
MLAGATREELGEARLAAAGWPLVAQTLDLARLDRAERAELLALLKLPSKKRDARGLAPREGELLGRCGRLDAPGLDLDAGLTCYALTWPGGGLGPVTVPVAEAQRLALEASERLATEEARRGVTLRRAWSGGPARAGLHLDWAEVAPDLSGPASEPELLRALLGRARDLATAAGVPTSEDLKLRAAELLASLAARGWVAPRRSGESPATALGAIRRSKAARLELLREPSAAEAAELLAELRAALPAVWLDLSVLNRDPGSRGGQFRPLGGAHKANETDPSARKTLLAGEPELGSPITRAMVEPYLAALREQAEREAELRAKPRPPRPRAPRSAESRARSSRGARSRAAAREALDVPGARGGLDHAGGLALGHVVWCAGLTVEVAEQAAQALSRDARQARDRAADARDAWRRAESREAAGRRSHGWPTLAASLGEDAAAELREWLDDLAGRRRGPRRVAARELPVVDAAAHAEWLRAALADPSGTLYLDRGATGSGKSYLAGAEAVRAAARGERVLVAAPNHVLASAWADRAAEARAELGDASAHVTVAAVPRLHCVASREDDYLAASARGWNPRQTVCAGCPRNPCAWIAASDAAWGADVVVAQHAHATLPGAWAPGARLDAFARVVIEEAPAWAPEWLLGAAEAAPAVEALREHATQAREDAGAAARELAVGDAEEREDAARAAAADRAARLGAADALDLALSAATARRVLRGRARRNVLGRARRALRRAAAAEAAAEALLAVEAARDGAPGEGVRVSAPGDLAPLLGSGAAGLEAVLRAALGPRARNPLPLALGLAEAQRLGRPLVAVRVAGAARADAPELLARLPRPLPLARGALVLDATADPAATARDHGRALGAVRVLDLAPLAELRVVQVEGSLWSRSKLGLGKRPREDAPAARARLAGLVAEIARRTGARRVGVVAYRGLVDPREGAPLLELLREAAPQVEEWRAEWFGALRGRNAFAPCEGAEGEPDAPGVDLVVVAGTPIPPAEAVLAEALASGAAPESLRGAARGWVGEGDAAEWTWPVVALRDAESRLVGAELAQAVGRAARGAWVAPHGCWLLASAAVELPWTRWAGTVADLGLGVAPATWDAVSGALDAGALDQEAARLTGAPTWQVYAVRAALPLWQGAAASGDPPALSGSDWIPL